MRNRATAVVLAVMLIGVIPAAGLALTPYSQDFELLVQTDTAALGNDGWLVFGNVFTPLGVYLYGYGPFAAPNHNLAFCQIDLLQGGPDQGLQQLVVFNDYNSEEHAGIDLNLVESNVFQEWVVDAGAVGETWFFQFDAKLGNIAGASTALAFIKTLDPGAGFALTNFISEDMTSIPVEWGTYVLEIPITADLVGQIIQIGFSCTASGFESSGIFYDNIFWEKKVSAVPELASGSLDQNYPNPFNPLTRIDFVLETAGMVDVSVYDLAGRRVATLHRGQLGSGDHHVTWDGRTDAGYAVAAGQYRYVMKTDAGQTARSMTLLK